MPSTVTVQVYKFSELSDRAKEHALDRYRSSGDDYFWGGDALASIEALAKHFGGRVRDYSLDWLDYNRSYMSFDMPGMGREEIEELLAQLGSYNKDTLRGDGECRLTGYCMDEDAIYGFRKAFHAGESDLTALMEAAYETFIRAAVADAEYQYSMEGYAEMAEANDYDFTEDGEIY